jgi:hypothetical protein
MAAATDNVEELLHAIQNTILENKKFLQNLEEENDDDELETGIVEAPKEEDEDFEEL